MNFPYILIYNSDGFVQETKYLQSYIPKEKESILSFYEEKCSFYNLSINNENGFNIVKDQKLILIPKSKFFNDLHNYLSTIFSYIKDNNEELYSDDIESIKLFFNSLLENPIIEKDNITFSDFQQSVNCSHLYSDSDYINLHNKINLRKVLNVVSILLLQNNNLRRVFKFENENESSRSYSELMISLRSVFYN